MGAWMLRLVMTAVIVFLGAGAVLPDGEGLGASAGRAAPAVELSGEGGEAMVTSLPSVSLVYGEQAWTRPGFDFRLHGGGADLLALPVTSYDRVLLFPFGLADAGREYEVERATRFTESLDGMRRLFSLQALLDELERRGKPPSMVTVYIPGWFRTNTPSWLKGMQPERFTSLNANGAARPDTFPARLYTLLQWLRKQDGTPRCRLAFDASGGDQTLTSCATIACMFAMVWGFEVDTEGHAYPGSPLIGLTSVTTAWAALESPSSLLQPATRRAILVSNNSGIGDPNGRYASGQPVGRFGRDHRQNFVPQWRRENRTVYVPVHDMDRDGTPPAYWVE